MEDLIKREDAIKAIEETPFLNRPILPHYIKAKIKDIPSVEPTIEIDAHQLAKLLHEAWTIDSEPKQGEWIDRTTLKGFPEYECSACHAYGQQWMTFCPHCGARMAKK